MQGRWTPFPVSGMARRRQVSVPKPLDKIRDLHRVEHLL
jgi:hypothetical protein